MRCSKSVRPSAGGGASKKGDTNFIVCGAGSDTPCGEEKSDNER